MDQDVGRQLPLERLDDGQQHQRLGPTAEHRNNIQQERLSETRTESYSGLSRRFRESQLDLKRRRQDRHRSIAKAKPSAARRASETKACQGGMVNLCPSTFHIRHTIVTQPNVLQDRKGWTQKIIFFCVSLSSPPSHLWTLSQMIARRVLHLSIHTYTTHNLSCAPPHHQIDYSSPNSFPKPSPNSSTSQCLRKFHTSTRQRSRTGSSRVHHIASTTARRSVDRPA